MSKVDIIRSWTDSDYRASLGEDAPAHPAGITILDDASLTAHAGGADGEAEAEAAKSFWCSFLGTRKTDTRCCPKW